MATIHQLEVEFHRLVNEAHAEADRLGWFTPEYDAIAARYSPLFDKIILALRVARRAEADAVPREIPDPEFRERYDRLLESQTR